MHISSVGQISKELIPKQGFIATENQHSNACSEVSRLEEQLVLLNIDMEQVINNVNSDNYYHDNIVDISQCIVPK